MAGTTKQRWLVLTQYYPPEIGAASIRLRHLVRQLVANGREVRVVTALPNYPTSRIFPAYRGRLYRKERLEGVEARRTWVYAATGRSPIARLLNYFSFTVSATVAALFGPKPDLMFVESRPSLGLAAVLMKVVRGVPYIYNVADFHLELAIGTGIVNNPVLCSPALKLEDFFLRHAWRVSTVTREFAEHLAARGIPRDRITFLPNGADPAFFKPQPPDPELRERWKLGDRKVFLYAGTYAYYHGLETLIEAAALLRERSELVFILCGDGPERPRLEQLALHYRLSNLLFTRIPYKEINRLYSIAYASVATLKNMQVAKGMRLAKIFPSLSCGVPVIYAGQGEGAELLEEHGCGLTTAPEDPGQLAAAVCTLADDPGLRNRMGRAGRSLIEREYDWTSIVARWLDELSGPPAPSGVRD